MKPSSFDYHAPDSVDGAVALLSELGDDAKVLAGGQSLIPLLSLRLASFEHLVDVSRIPELAGVQRDDGAVVVGAATVDSVAERDPHVTSGVPLLKAVTPYVGHFQIRNRGTVGGSIAHADPCAEYPAVALALEAEMEVVSSRGSRWVPASEFFAGFWTTVVGPDELLARVRFPVWTGRCGFAVQEFARRHGDFALAGAVVAVEFDSADRITRCAIGLLGLGPTPLRARAAEQEAIGRDGTDIASDVGRLAMQDLSDVPSDVHGSAAYRRRVGAAMVRRAFTDAVDEASRA